MKIEKSTDISFVNNVLSQLCGQKIEVHRYYPTKSILILEFKYNYERWYINLLGCAQIQFCGPCWLISEAGIKIQKCNEDYYVLNQDNAINLYFEDLSLLKEPLV